MGCDLLGSFVYYNQGKNYYNLNQNQDQIKSKQQLSQRIFVLTEKPKQNKKFYILYELCKFKIKTTEYQNQLEHFKKSKRIFNLLFKLIKIIWKSFQNYLKRQFYLSKLIL
ncbi:unnamed protein product [Paramecium sonneborni]|uniref:Uncharacterized protein n=1 Tax=Paramecium sonneborni TaxID=65129 RepID=A0A8S1MU96_9CILI|nr:unnamed protein product [Paramecium sonneborni]